MREVIVNVSSEEVLEPIRSYYKYFKYIGEETRIGFNVAATISAESYTNIVDNIFNANCRSGTRRYDYIVRPRGIPFAPPPTVTIRNYFEFNSAFREKGKEMIIIIPRDVSNIIYDRLLSHAKTNKVLVGGHFRDMWND
uniref:Uncharacterized protein n=1 Tax=Fagus sylvatica TaxID=28930 RepID=A0A2N9EHX8_FAGSY